MVYDDDVLTPQTPEELAGALGSAAARGQSVCLGGAFSKRRMAGPLSPADLTISATALNRVLQYEPNDLTISVQAGVKWRDLTAVLAAHRQSVPLDPPFPEGTVGGVIAANLAGPRRRLYGTARDFVIGMQFATMAGRLVQSGGMVVKNVAGLDMAKLMIGSFGTLAAITTVNFKVIPEPRAERSFLLSFDSAAEAAAARTAILRGVLQPAAIDLLSPPAAAVLDRSGYVLALRAAGNQASVERFTSELGRMGYACAALGGEAHAALWETLREYTPRFLAAHPDGAVVRVSGTLRDVESVMTSFDVPAVARAGSGVCYGYFAEAGQAAPWCAQAAARGWQWVIEFAPEERWRAPELWPAPGGDFALMQRVKGLFDPQGLLNRGRLYGRI